MALSVASSRELLNSYFTWSAWNTVFSFSWDWVGACFSSRSRMNAVDFWSNLKKRRWVKNSQLKYWKCIRSSQCSWSKSYEQDLPQWRIVRSKRERSLVQYLTAKQQSKVERDAFEWLLHNLQITYYYPLRDSRLKHFYAWTMHTEHTPV